MGNDVDTFGLYVAGQLEVWGREFALHRDCEYRGHRSKDMLQVLIEHKGEMPPRVTGFKPMEILPEAMMVEDIITDMARADVTKATVMRAYYCGSGRRMFERLDQCNALLEGISRERVLSGLKPIRPLRREAYRVAQMTGFDWVRGVLLGYARAA